MKFSDKYSATPFWAPLRWCCTTLIKFIILTCAYIFSLLACVLVKAAFYLSQPVDIKQNAE